MRGSCVSFTLYRFNSVAFSSGVNTCAAQVGSEDQDPWAHSATKLTLCKATHALQLRDRGTSTHCHRYRHCNMSVKPTLALTKMTCNCRIGARR